MAAPTYEVKKMQIHLTPKSRNVKTGPIPTSTSGAETCPDACPFKSGNGCYAESGPQALHWRKVTAGERGDNFGDFLDKISALPRGQLWRHNVSGDLAGKNDALDIAALAELVTANTGRRGFTYTHKPLRREIERRAIRDANAGGFTVNLSANNVEHADTLAALNIGPVATVLPIEYERKNQRGAWVEGFDEYKNRLKTLPQTTPSGLRLVVCPATYDDGVSCDTCKLCAVATRKSVVGFPAHGAARRKAEKASAGAAQ